MRISRFFVLSALVIALTLGFGLAAASAQTGYGDDVAEPRTLTVDPPSGEAASSSDDDGTSTGVIVGLIAGALLVAGGAGFGLYKLRQGSG